MIHPMSGLWAGRDAAYVVKLAQLAETGFQLVRTMLHFSAGVRNRAKPSPQ
jgi:hypothetical protein